jgi:hypothetical protein
MDARFGILEIDATHQEPYRQLFSNAKIQIVIATSVVNSAIIKSVAERAAAILGRLFDDVVILNDGEPYRDSRADHEDFCERVPGTDDPAEPAAPTVRVGIGPVKDATFYVTFQGWTVTRSSKPQQQIDDACVGALLAPSLIAAECFKWIFRCHSRRILIADYELDVLTYGKDIQGSRLAQMPHAVFDLLLAGVGSIGFGVVEAMCEFKETMEGRVVLVDNGTLQSRNFRKYSLVTKDEADRGLPKLDVANDKLEKSQSKLNVIKKPYPIADLSSHADSSAAVTIVSMDNITARVAAQELLSRDVINVGIDGSSVEVSSLHFGMTPCINCLYKDQANAEPKIEVIAKSLGLTVARAQYLDETNTGLTKDDIDAMRDVWPAYKVGALAELLGQPLSSAKQAAGYAEVDLQIREQNPVRVSTPFVSNFAGVIAFIEALKVLAELEVHRLENSFHIDLLGIPNYGAVIKRARLLPGECVCFDPSRLDYFYDRWYAQPGE